MDPQKHYSSSPRGWVRNFCQVDWTCIFFIIVLGIATGAVQKAATVQRPVYIGDATIAFPHADSNSIAFWVALVIPAIILLLSAVVLEFVVFRRQGSGQAWMMLLNIFLAVLAALAVTGFITELFKRICGRLRPDFLDRCQPAKMPAGTNPVAFGTFPDVTCTNDVKAEIKDGHLSFPSGHSSCSMAIGLFTALYVMWAVHMRANRDSLAPRAACTNGAVCFGTWLRLELLRLVVILVVLFQLAWPWGVAVSRFRDNRHNVSDVVGGLLLGVCFAPLFVARLAWHHNGWLEVDQQHAASGLHPATSSSAAVLPMMMQPTSSMQHSNGHSVGMAGVHGHMHPAASIHA